MVDKGDLKWAKDAFCLLEILFGHASVNIKHCWEK